MRTALCLFALAATVLAVTIEQPSMVKLSTSRHALQFNNFSGAGVRNEHITAFTNYANSAVSVVPIFSPSIMDAATSNGIQPLAVITNVKVIAALDDCIMIVSNAPTPTNINRDSNDGSAYELKN